MNKKGYIAAEFLETNIGTLVYLWYGDYLCWALVLEITDRILPH